MTVRHYHSLYRRYRAIGIYASFACFISGLTILSPLLALFAYPEELPLAPSFAVPGLGLSLLGLILWKRLSRTNRPDSLTSDLTMPEGAVVVLIAWLTAIGVSAIPFALVSDLTITQALFESTSGWTTTGLSVVNVTQSSHLILLFRSITQLVGGAGFAIIALTAAGSLSLGFAAAEGRSEQLVPNLTRSATLVLRIYSIYALLGTGLLYWAGLGWFDAINHAFAAVSTGGFSTKASSIGYWNNPMLEAIVMGLMLCSSLNYVVAYLGLRGKIRPLLRHCELRLQAVVLPICVGILLVSRLPGLYPTLIKTLRVALFEVVTALSTTGFTTTQYDDWSSLAWLIAIVLMAIGGGAGSTAGGMKQFRIYALYRALTWEIRHWLLPKAAVTEPSLWQGDRKRFLSDRDIRQIALFVCLYLFLLVLSMAAIAGYGYSLQDSLFESVSALSTVGLSVGVTSADAPAGVLWVETAAMVLGRLEFFSVIVGAVRIWGDVWSVLQR